MKSTVSRSCFHLVISMVAIPGMLSDIFFIKLIILIYAIYLVLKKKAEYLPALMVISTFTANSYFILLAMAVVSVINYSVLREAKVQYLFLFLLLYILYIGYQIISMIYSGGSKIGIIMSQYEYYFSLFAFFYGIILMKSFNTKILNAVFVTLILLSVVDLLKPYIDNLPTVRLVFYSFPLFSVLLIYSVYTNDRILSMLQVLLLFLITTSFFLSGLTFTLLLSVLLSIYLAYLYFKRKGIFLFRFTGYPIYIFLTISMIYTISTFDKSDYSAYKNMQMSEIISFESLSDRFKMKLFEDRGPIWAGVWMSIVTRPQWMPPESVESVKVVNKSGGKDIDFEFHTHNIFLDIIRENGLIFGISFIFVYVRILLLGRKVVFISGINPLFMLLVLNAISCMIIGSFTGVYVLLTTFSIFILTLLGIAYAAYEDPNIFKSNMAKIFR